MDTKSFSWIEYRPIISIIHRSEIHAVMTGGFATIAGTVLAAYVSFGVSASHLVSAVDCFSGGAR